MINRLIRIGALLTGFVAGGVLAAARGLPSPHEADAAEERREQGEEASRSRSFVRIAKLFILFLVILGFGGLLIATSGIIPIKASSSHWPITRWFLHFAKERSVATHSLGLEAPPLDEPGLALKGAGHYEFGCRPCHGSPALARPRVAWQMTPSPPYLPPKVSEWENEELFYIVKHGIRFTGMPAWPAQQRDDEVWAMVAFLRKFPKLNAEEYTRMARGEAAESVEAAPLPGLLGPESVPPAITTSCARCHGVNGLGRGLGAFPKLAGQNFDYLDQSLQAYARGQRHSGVMQPIAAGLSDEEMRELARYYANLPRPSPSPSQATSAIERGKIISLQGIPSQQVPACAACHGPGALPRNPVFPELAGQYSDYLVLQIEIIKKGLRGGTAYAHVMRQVAVGLTPEQMHDAALYYDSLSSSSDAHRRN